MNEWYDGVGLPSPATGKNHDYYLDLKTSDVFKKMAGLWTYRGNIKGDSGSVIFEELTPAQIESLRGPQGIQGIQGPVGPAGGVGPVGPVGPQGQQGLQGPEGPKGADGVVVFEELTPEQIATLTGPQGPQGDMGPQGPQGPAGADGRDGINGIDGERGLDGLQGPQGPQGLPGTGLHRTLLFNGDTSTSPIGTVFELNDLWDEYDDLEFLVKMASDSKGRYFKFSTLNRKFADSSFFINYTNITDSAPWITYWYEFRVMMMASGYEFKIGSAHRTWMKAEGFGGDTNDTVSAVLQIYGLRYETAQAGRKMKVDQEKVHEFAQEERIARLEEDIRCLEDVLIAKGLATRN